jgi:hypothetical protein
MQQHYNYNFTHNYIYLFTLFIFVTYYTYIEYELSNPIYLLLFINLIVEDFYSGILHIVLDEPENQNLIIIGSYAKLFQEHHIYPYIIYKKIKLLEQLLEVKLLSVVCFIWAIIIGLYDNHIYEYTLNVLIITLYSIYGQWNHRNSHIPNNNNIFYKLCCYFKLSITQNEHNKHHKTYDNNFSITTGWSNSIINYLYSKIKNRFFYLFIFTLMTIYLGKISYIINRLLIY